MINKFDKMILGLLTGKYQKTSQVLQGAAVSGFDRLTGGIYAPGPLTIGVGGVKAYVGLYGNIIGEFKMPVWKKTSLYAIGAALPYADKIYCSLAPTIETLIN